MDTMIVVGFALLVIWLAVLGVVLLMHPPRRSRKDDGTPPDQGV